jgi:hypothetical protein
MRTINFSLTNTKYSGVGGMINYQSGNNQITTVDTYPMMYHINHSLAMQPTHNEIKNRIIENFETVEVADRTRLVMGHLNQNLNPDASNQTRSVYNGVNTLLRPLYENTNEVVPETQVAAILNANRKISALAESMFQSEALDLTNNNVINDITKAVAHSESISKTMKYKEYANSEEIAINFVRDMDMSHHSDLINMVVVSEQNGIVSFLCNEHNIAIISGVVFYIGVHRLLLIPGNYEDFLKDSLNMLERKLSIMSLLSSYTSNMFNFKNYFIPTLKNTVKRYVSTYGTTAFHSGMAFSVSLHLCEYMYPGITSLKDFSSANIVVEVDFLKQFTNQRAKYIGDVVGGVVGGLGSGFVVGALRSKVDVIVTISNRCNDGMFKDFLNLLVDVIRAESSK